jgi:hypothetical protein
MSRKTNDRVTVMKECRIIKKMCPFLYQRLRRTQMKTSELEIVTQGTGKAQLLRY